jgi:hypothetical protein
MDTFMPCTRTLGTGASCRLAAQVDILRYQLLAATVSERSGFSEHFPHSLRLEATGRRETRCSRLLLYSSTFFAFLTSSETIANSSRSSVRPTT